MVDKIRLRRVEALVAVLSADKVFFPGSAEYNASLSSYFSPQAAAVHPACFVAPQSATDVSAVVSSLTSDGPCDFAVRAGGHTWFADANSAPGGITIDLRRLNSIELSADKTTVSVGSGATWDAVYRELEREGLSVAGGRTAGVGVGGLTLGGGISYFGPREGLTCNQVTSFEVVLACGSVVVADETQNADLWWGLRGGSNNFGIVTRFTFKTFEQGLVWSSLTLNPLSEVDNQARIYGELMAAENYDVNASFLTGWAFASQQGLSVTLNQLVYTRPVEGDAPAFYKPILDLPAISNASAPAAVANMSTIAQNAVAFQKPQAARYMTATTTFVPTEAMIRATYETFNASLQLVQNVAGIMWAVNIEPLPPQIYERGGAHTNALGLTGRHGSSLAVGLVSPSWSNADDDEAVYAAARALMADIESRAKKLGAYDPYVYFDYAAPWQEVIRGYGEENVRKLQDLRNRVDPRRVFTNMVKGGFKIPEEGH